MAKPRAPRLHINPQLRVRVYRSGRLLRQIAEAAGYPSFTFLSTTLNDDRVAASPLAVSRLRLVAVLVGFDPDSIFIEGIPEPPKGEAFDADHLPRPAGAGA